MKRKPACVECIECLFQSYFLVRLLLRRGQRREVDAVAGDQHSPRFSSEARAYLTDPHERYTRRIGADGRVLPASSSSRSLSRSSPSSPPRVSPLMRPRVDSVSPVRRVSASASPLVSSRSHASPLSRARSASSRASPLLPDADADVESDGEFEAQRQRRGRGGKDLAAGASLAAALRAALEQQRNGVDFERVCDELLTSVTEAAHTSASRVDLPAVHDAHGAKHTDRDNGNGSGSGDTTLPPLSDAERARAHARRTLLAAFERQRAEELESRARWAAKLAAMQPPPPTGTMKRL